MHRQTKTITINTPEQEDKIGKEVMTAFIDITPKSHKNGQIFINDQVQNMKDCQAWFDLNMDYLKKVAKRKSIESVTIYVKEQHEVIYTSTI